MTRDEAIKKFEERHNNYAANWAARWIDAFSDIGMLKLDEPESVSDRFIDALEAHVEHKHIGDLLHALDCANLKIVEK